MALPLKVLPIGALAAAQTARATYEDPLHVLGRTVGGVPKLAAGAVAGLAELPVREAIATAHGHPLQVPKAIGRSVAADVTRRYGPLTKGGAGAKAFRERIKKEGALPEAVDFAGLATLGGATGGQALSEAARAGMLGERAARFASEARPGLRVAGGKVRAQELSPNLVRATGQRAEDRLRAAKFARVGAKGIQPEGHEVAPIFAARAQRIEASKLSSRAHIRLKRRQAAELAKGSVADVAKLNKHQRRVVFHSVQGLVTPDDPVRAVRQLRARRAAIVAERKAAGTRIPAKLRATHDELATIDYAIKHAREIFNPKLRQFVAREADRAKRLGEFDPSLRSFVAEARRLRPQGEALGIPHTYSELRVGIERLRSEGKLTDPEAETRLAQLEDLRPQLDAAYATRVRGAAAKAGLPEPGFLSHFKYDEPRHLAYTAGQGARAAAGPKRSTMALFRTGRADQRARALFDSHAASIRRAINWRLVDEQFRTHAMPIGADEVRAVTKRKGAHADSLRPAEVKDALLRRGLDPRDYVLYQPGRLEAVDAETGATAKGVLGIAADEHVPAEFRTTRGYYAMPKPAWEAIAGHFHTPTLAGRVFDKTMGLQSAALLGLSPAWAGFQVGANAFLSAIAHKGNLIDAPNAARWWKTLTPEERAVIDEHLGSGVAVGHTQRVRMGSVVDERGKLATAWRAFSTAPGFRHAGKANPFTALFKLDETQNRAFRRTLLYSNVKREAFRQLTGDLGALARTQQRVGRVLSLGPEDLMREIVRDPAQLERHGEATLRVLGDYSRYTARERATLKRYVLFYGFLRYAVRTAFFTLPVQHPLATALTAQLGELHDREVEDLLGGPTRPWNYSKIFVGDGSRSIDLARMSPVSNPIYDIAQEGPKGAGGLMSPLLASAMDQVYGESAFTGKPFTGHGSPEFGSGLDAESRLRIFAGDVIRTTAPGRVAIALGNRGAVTTDDSLPWSQRPVRYKTAAAIRRAHQRIGAQGSARDIALGGLVPFYPKPDVSKAIAGSAAAAPLDARQRRALERARRAQRSTGGDAQARALARARAAAGR